MMFGHFNIRTAYMIILSCVYEIRKYSHLLQRLSYEINTYNTIHVAFKAEEELFKHLMPTMSQHEVN